MCGFCNVWVCGGVYNVLVSICVGFVMCVVCGGFCNLWVCVCVCMCGYFDNCVGVLVICVLVFTVFLYCFVYVYLFLFVLSVLP